METNDLIRLKTIIREEMGDCNSELWPNLCKLRSTEKGYAKIEEMVIRMVAKDRMPVGSALSVLEQEFTHSGQVE